MIIGMAKLCFQPRFIIAANAVEREHQPQFVGDIGLGAVQGDDLTLQSSQVGAGRGALLQDPPRVARIPFVGMQLQPDQFRVAHAG